MTLWEYIRSVRIPLWLVVLGTCVGIFGGIIGGFILCFHIHNYHAGIWSFISAVPALWCLHLHSLHHYKSVDYVHTSMSLKVLTHYATAISMVSLLAAVTYNVLALIFHQPLFPVEHSLIMGGVQAFISAKWHFLLRYHAKRYRRMLEEGYLSRQDLTAEV